MYTNFGQSNGRSPVKVADKPEKNPEECSEPRLADAHAERINQLRIPSLPPSQFPFSLPSTSMSNGFL